MSQQIAQNAQGAQTSAAPAAVKQFPAGAGALKVLEVNLFQVLPEYEEPMTVPAWRWIREQAQFRHKDNGVHGGGYEFLVYVGNSAERDNSDVPVELKPYFDFAQQEGYIWILFHQS